MATLVASLALAVAGCDASGGDGLDLQTPAETTTTAPSPTPTVSPTPTAEEQILGQYTRFFEALTPLSQTEPQIRLVELREVATEPALSRVAGGMIAADSIGEIGYGRIVTNPQITRIAGGTAWIRDCQDTSQAGRVRAETGERTTVGISRSLAEVTMLRGDDGVWRVSTAEYQQGATC